MDWFRFFENSKQILVAEDDLSLQPFLTRLMRSVDDGCKISWVQSGSEAMLEMVETRYDLVVADVFLKGNLTGLDLWEHYKREQMREGAFLFMSGTTERALNAYVPIERIESILLAKPLQVSDCKRKISAALV